MKSICIYSISYLEIVKPALGFFAVGSLWRGTVRRQRKKNLTLPKQTYFFDGEVSHGKKSHGEKTEHEFNQSVDCRC